MFTVPLQTHWGPNYYFIPPPKCNVTTATCARSICVLWYLLPHEIKGMMVHCFLWHNNLIKYPAVCVAPLFSSLVVWACLRLGRRKSLPVCVTKPVLQTPVAWAWLKTTTVWHWATMHSSRSPKWKLHCQHLCFYFCDAILWKDNKTGRNVPSPTRTDPGLIYAAALRALSTSGHRVDSVHPPTWA